MEASASAREPLQVSRLTCRFAGQTGGPVARSHGLLDSLFDRLAHVCRWPDDVVNLLREPLNISTTPHGHELHDAAAAGFVFPHYP